MQQKTLPQELSQCPFCLTPDNDDYEGITQDANHCSTIGTGLTP